MRAAEHSSLEQKGTDPNMQQKGTDPNTQQKGTDPNMQKGTDPFIVIMKGLREIGALFRIRIS